MTFAVTSTFERCRICGEYDFSRSHRCGPCFEVRYADDDDTGFRDIYATDAKAAAEKFHDKNFSSSDYAMHVTVVVRNAEHQRRTFDVHVETVPEMHATAKGEWSAPETEPEEETEP